MKNEANPKTHYVGYARVSTDDQNLDLQIDALTAFGVQREDIHTDTASGASTERPGFIAMMKDIREGDTLVIWKLDRLGRDLSQLVQTAERVAEKKAELIILQDGIDTKTPMGRFMFGVMGSFAQLEREMIVERTKAGLLAARLRGRVGGRKATLTLDQFEKVERLIRDKADGGSGLSLRQATKRAGMSTTRFYNWKKEKARVAE